jgi:chromosome segregation ATPase
MYSLFFINSFIHSFSTHQASRNEFLVAESARQHTEIESFFEKAGQSRKVNEATTLQLLEAKALQEDKDAKILETESRNKFLVAESVRQQTEIESLREQVAQLRTEHETATMRLQESKALMDDQDAQIQKAESLNEFLVAEAVKQQTEIESLREQAINLRKDLDDECTRSLILVNKSHDE